MDLNLAWEDIQSPPPADCMPHSPSLLAPSSCQVGSIELDMAWEGIHLPTARGRVQETHQGSGGGGGAGRGEKGGRGDGGGGNEASGDRAEAPADDPWLSLLPPSRACHWSLHAVRRGLVGAATRSFLGLKSTERRRHYVELQRTAGISLGGSGGGGGTASWD